MKYRKKPVIVEAEQYSLDRHREEGYLPPGVDHAFFMDEDGVQQEKLNPIIKTLEGTLSITDGDWIIKGIQGEFYPCKPDIFEATYDAVD